MPNTDTRRTQVEPPARSTKPMREPMPATIKARNEQIRQHELQHGEYAIKQHPPSFHVAATSMLIS